MKQQYITLLLLASCGMGHTVYTMDREDKSVAASDLFNPRDWSPEELLRARAEIDDSTRNHFAVASKISSDSSSESDAGSAESATRDVFKLQSGNYFNWTHVYGSRDAGVLAQLRKNKAEATLAKTKKTNIKLKYANIGLGASLVASLVYIGRSPLAQLASYLAKTPGAIAGLFQNGCSSFCGASHWKKVGIVFGAGTVATISYVGLRWSYASYLNSKRKQANSNSRAQQSSSPAERPNQSAAVDN